MNPYCGPSGLQNPERNRNADSFNSCSSCAFCAAEAWERFAHTGGISDYLQYRRLENHRLEVSAHYGGTDKDQWGHSPNPYDG